MRILFISTFYPPHVVGGWEQLVHDIDEGMQARGHETYVLTSTYGTGAPSREGNVFRYLHLESDIHHYQPLNFATYRSKLNENLNKTKEVIEAVSPDVIFVHVMWNLTRGVPWMAEQYGAKRVVYYVANDWPYATDPHTAYWRDLPQSSSRRAGKRVLGWLPQKMVAADIRRFALSFEHVLCVSEAVKQSLARKAHIDPQNMCVVHNGVEEDIFHPREKWAEREFRDGPLSLLYAGSLTSHKGVQTAVEAMAELHTRSDPDSISLTIAGSGHEDYETRLRQLVAAFQLGERVHFVGRVRRNEMPALMRQHDVLVLPSTWEEPLARVMQEAMACGLLVIGTLTGGTGELLIEGETGLTFAPHDAHGLAQQIGITVANPQLYWDLAQNGRNQVLSRFTMRRMIDEIETSLYSVIVEA